MYPKNLFITFREENNEGDLCYYILQKNHPHYVGKIVNYPIEGAIVNMPLPEYNLWVTYAGVLEGRFVPGYKEVEADIESMFSQMAEWYYHYRIKTNPKKYIKFKMTNDSIPGK